MILNKNLSSCQILNQIFFVLSDSNSIFLQRVRFWNENFTTRHILNWNNLPKSTTCTFHIAFLHKTLWSCNPQYLLHLDNSVRHRSNNAFCTLFRKDFHFWFRYGVPLSFLILLDIFKNLLLLKVKLQQIIQFLSLNFWLVLKKVMIKRNTLIEIYIKTQTR